MPRRTQDTARGTFDFVYRACTFCGWPFNAIQLSSAHPTLRSYNPSSCWFGLLRFRSPLLSESFLFSSPPGTKMFQFPGLPSLKLCIGFRMIQYYLYRVSPFGYPRIVVCVRLPEAFRRFLRPSSALYAKTSTVRSYSFIRVFTRTVNYFF